MRVRDRLVVAVIVAVAIAGLMWVALVSPERSQVTTLNAQVASQRTALAGAEAEIANARRAVTGYLAHVHQIDQVIKAVPEVAGEAEVVATIDRLTGTKVEPDFRELDVGAAGTTSTGPQSLGLTFTYWTTYKGLQTFLDRLDALTATNGVNVRVRGRLFTVTAVSLAPVNTPQAPADVTRATVTAQVYLQGAPATGATSPTGATGSSGATS